METEVVFRMQYYVIKLILPAHRRKSECPSTSASQGASTCNYGHAALERPPSKHPRALHVTSRCFCMCSLSCERKGWTREGLICKYGEGCRFLFAKLPQFSFYPSDINRTAYKKAELVMMVCLPSCNIGRPIYIWRIERKLWQFCKKTPTALSTFANKAFPRSSFSPTR